MSSSSGPEPAGDAAPRRRGDRAGRASSARGATAGRGRARRAARRRGRSRREGWLTVAWAAPGTLWLIFFLVAPLVMIVLVSFWTTDITGFEKDFTLDAYRTLFGSLTYWNQLKESFFVTCIVSGSCLVLGFPIAYFLVVQDQDDPEPARAVHRRARAVLDELPDPRDRLGVPASWAARARSTSSSQKIGLIDEPLDIRLLEVLGRRWR